jgi:hypothetical protein
LKQKIPNNTYIHLEPLFFLLASVSRRQVTASNKEAQQLFSILD